MKKNSELFFREWHKIIEVRDKTDALLFQHPECEHITSECGFRQKELKKLRDIIFRSTGKASKTMASLSGAFSKQEALLSHLVSMVEEVDTGKGTETKGGQ